MMNIYSVEPEYTDYLHDESLLNGLAEKIAFVRTATDVTNLLKNQQSLTIQGGRTGVTGGCVPQGGMILNTSKMRKIEEVEQNGFLTVQPGVSLLHIREKLKDTTWFFPPDPTETTASIGGMIANNASGARSFYYGATRNWIHKIEVVLANGEKIALERGLQKAKGQQFKIGSFSGKLPLIKPRTKKNAAGYFIQPNMDLIDLFIGSEGSLGVITQATLKLCKKPKQTVSFLPFFKSEQNALKWLYLLKEKYNPLSIEFFDDAALGFLQQTAFLDLKPPLEAQSALFFEYQNQIPNELVEDLDQDAFACWIAETNSEKERLNSFRHALPEAVNQQVAKYKKKVPGLTKLGTDMAVCEGQIQQTLELYRSDLKKEKLEYVIFGHIGDNHLHVNVIPKTQEEYMRGKNCYQKWAKQIIQWGGTISAEHGVGKLKTQFFKMMYSPSEYQGMYQLKQLFDPLSLLNPGTLFSHSKTSF